jgi:hypothetical protein
MRQTFLLVVFSAILAAAYAQMPGPSPATTTHTAAFPAGDPRKLDPQFAADTRGQWATQASASSQYGATTYSAAQATGALNVEKHGDDARAWASAEPDHGVETLTLTFAQPVHATEVRVRQSFNPGAITRIEVAGGGGAKQIVFEGPDLAIYPAYTVGWLVIPCAPTVFLATSVTITLDTTRVKGWNEIDAVQLAGDPDKPR